MSIEASIEANDEVTPPSETEETEGKQERARRESLGLAFFWLVILAYGFFVPATLSWNTESHLYPAFAIVDHGTINIDAYQQGLGDKSYWHGHYYTDKAPGLSFLAVPAYAAIRVAFPGAKVVGFQIYKHIAGYYYIPDAVAYVRYGITYLLVSVPSAILAILLWLFLMRVSRMPGWSLFLAATYALGTMAYVYSIWYFSHQLCAVLLFGAFLLLFFKVRDKPWSRSVLLASAGAGLLTGYSIISEYPTVVIGFLLGLYLLLVARDRLRSAGAFVGGMVPPLALNVAYNLMAYGKPFATGYLYVHSQAYHINIKAGPLGLTNPSSLGIQLPSLHSLYEITFGLYRGIFPISPVLLLFFAGLYFMSKRRDMRPEFWLCLAVVVIYFLMDAGRPADTNGWSGGASVASRHLTPMLPFMVVPIVFGFHNRIFRIVFSVLAVISIVLMFMIVSSTYLFPYNDSNPLANEVFPNFFNGQIKTNWIILWHSSFHLSGFASLAPFFVVAALLVARIGWLLGRSPASTGPPRTEGSV